MREIEPHHVVPSALVQIAKAGEERSACSALQRTESTAVQTAGAVVSLRRSFVRLN